MRRFFCALENGGMPLTSGVFMVKWVGDRTKDTGFDEKSRKHAANSEGELV